MATGGASPTWSTYNGKYRYGASGKREVLLITSNFATQDDDVIPRRPGGELKDDETRKLENQGIPRDCHHDDLSIMKARFSLDKTEISIAEVLRDDGSLTCEQVTKKITQLQNNTDTCGVILYYVGPGKKGTGDWCFSDGFISFRDIMHLYLQNAYFKGRVLSITTDCSYSGCWVKEAMRFMDEHGVGPCAHAAKEKGILVKVYASCLANEIPAELAFSARCVQNEKNIGTVSYSPDTKIHDGQYTSKLNFTVVRCKRKIDQPCTMAPGSTWQQWSAAKRIMTVRDKGRPSWRYLLLVDDEETIRKFHDRTQEENEGESSADVSYYGQILKSGWGQEPSEEAQKWIKEHYHVNYNYQAPSEED